MSNSSMRYGHLAEVGYASCTAPAGYQATLPLGDTLMSLGQFLSETKILLFKDETATKQL